MLASKKLGGDEPINQLADGSLGRFGVGWRGSTPAVVSCSLGFSGLDVDACSDLVGLSLLADLLSCSDCKQQKSFPIANGRDLSTICKASGLD